MSWLQTAFRDAGIGRRGTNFEILPTSPITRAGRTANAVASGIETFAEGVGNIFAHPDAPNKYNIREGRHNDGSGPGQYRGPRGRQNDQSQVQNAQEARPVEYDTRRFNADGTPRQAPLPGAFDPVTRTFLEQETAAPAVEVLTPLPSLTVEAIDSAPLAAVVQPAPFEVTAAVAAPAASDSAVPAVAQAAEPASATFDISGLTAGTPLTHVLLNQMSDAGIHHTQVGQGADAMHVFMKDGRIVGGVGDRVGNDASGFLTRDQLETQLAANGKSVAGFETMANMANIQATNAPAPATEAPAATTELASTATRPSLIGPPV